MAKPCLLLSDHRRLVGGEKVEGFVKEASLGLVEVHMQQVLSSEKSS